MKRVVMFLFMIVLGQVVLTESVSASSYRYDEDGNAVPAQASFTAAASYNGVQLDIGAFSNPTDLYVDEDAGYVYILDAGNNRIVVLDETFSLVKVIDEITGENGEESITGATGMFVDDDGLIYLADGANYRVLVIDFDGNVEMEITRPDSSLLTDDIAFIPENVVIDNIGTIYIISDQSTQGAYMVSKTGEFLGFYGRNEVQVTAQTLYISFLRKIVSEEYRERLQNFIPVEFANFDIDADGFIYTVTAVADDPESYDMIRKLNPLGDNVLSNMYRDWGDEPDGSNYYTSYTDVAVDSDGFIYALDSYTGRIFQYDNNGYQIAIFGGSGSQLGTFKSPVAIDSLGNKIIVLDSQKANLTVFEETTFGNYLRTATVLYNEGKTDEALSYYLTLTEMDGNFSFGYYAISNIYAEQENYEEALRYSELTQSASEVYSEAKKGLRREWMQEHFAMVFFGVIIAFILIVMVGKVLSVRRQEKAVEEKMRRRSE